MKCCSDKRVHTKSEVLEKWSVDISVFVFLLFFLSRVFQFLLFLMTYIASSNTACARVLLFLLLSFPLPSFVTFCFSHPRIEVCKTAGMAYITFLGFAYLNAVKKMQMRRVRERERDSYWSLSFPCMEQEWVLVGLCYVLQASPTPHRSAVNVWSESTSLKYLKCCSSCSATLFVLDKIWLCEPAGRKPTK